MVALKASKVMDAALDMLKKLVEGGMEFPDATAKVCQKFKCRSADLQEAYDALHAKVSARLNASTRLMLTSGARDINFVPQYLAKIFRPIQAKFVKQSGKNYFFRTESKIGKDAILALLGKLPEATVEQDTVTVNCQSVLGIVYEERLRVLANDDPDSRMFNILIED